MRVALCSKSMELVDGNFNKARYFMIYDVSMSGVKFVEVREPEKIGVMLDSDEIDERIDAISDCKMVFCSNIPRTSKARLLSRGVFTVWMRKEREIGEMLEELVEHMRVNPPPMIRKILEEEKV